MAYNLQRFNSGTLDKGVQSRTMDFQTDIVLDISSYNMSQGIQQGLGPRPGMATIPGQGDAETISSSRLPGLRASEGNAAQGLTFRRKVLAVYPITIVDPTGGAISYTASYLWIVTRSTDASSSNNEWLDFMVASTLSSSREYPSANIYDGLGTACYSIAPDPEDFIYLEGIVSTSGSGKQTVLQNYLAQSGATTAAGHFCSSAFFAVTGANIPMQWMLGKATATGDATHAPSVNFLVSTSIQWTAGTATDMACGVTTEYQLQNFTKTPRAMKIFALANTAALNIGYSALVNPATTNMKTLLDTGGLTNPHLDLSAITATKDTAGTSYASTVAALVNDPMSVTNASYKAMLVAQGKPYACVFQDGFRATSTSGKGKPNQWIDLTQNTWQPRAYASSYTEETVSTKTGFAYWPAFVRGTAMVAGTNSLGLTAASTGILRANTVYEFTYALYNKRLGFETNVAPPVKIQTGVTDFVSLNLFTPSSGGNSVMTEYRAGNKNAMFPLFGTWTDATVSEAGQFMGVNYTEYRFYFRQEGTFEWLPALFIDAAKYWFYPNFTKIAACTGALAATVGGQPGGFNDYSPLPQDTYNCVVQYKDRAWWISDRAIVFSLRNNLFCYPARNSISATGGKFKGAIVHNYPGQAEQSSRLVIFGTKEVYVARFTGVRAQAAVQVSPDASGVFDIDGSDLVIDPWTSVTAFSYRSAVVAEGILYWWGPQGVFRDDGVETPTRVSSDIEPDLFTLFAPSKTDQIFAHYNNQTKEIEWFYPPKVTTVSGEVTASIIFNTISGNWTIGKYTQQIDWIQQLQIDSNISTAGSREVLGTRLTATNATTTNKQRGYFFDQRNRAGDIAPKTDFVVKEVSTPVAGRRRLTLATGFDATNLATIVAGDYIATQQVTDYSGLAAASDMIATVVSVNSVAGTIDITLPTGATLPTGTLTFDQYFPIWHLAAAGRGLNGIPFNFSMRYWFPKGSNGYFFWLYCYLLAKMDLWTTDAELGWTISYRTPTASAAISDFIAFTDNSDGNQQTYHPLRPGEDNHEGQGIKFAISGNHIGHEWVLQYMEAHGTPLAGDPLKRFEG